MKLQYSLSGALLALTTALILEGALNLPLIVAWLIGINLFTFLFYAIDKLNSQSSAADVVRMPEATLLFLALVGGSPAALVAMALLGHKTNKLEFILPLLFIMAVQGTLLYSYRDSLPWP